MKTEGVDSSQTARERRAKKVVRFVTLLIVGSVLYTAYGVFNQLPSDQLLWRMIDAIGLGLIVSAVLAVSED